MFRRYLMNYFERHGGEFELLNLRSQFFCICLSIGCQYYRRSVKTLQNKQLLEELRFMGFYRSATVTITFFLSGNPSIDYFVSAGVMEPQNRTALSEEDEAYSEQV